MPGRGRLTGAGGAARENPAKGFPKLRKAHGNQGMA